MIEILVLCTWWGADYWERDDVAPYTKRSAASIQHLKNALPLPAIGIYTKGRDRDFTSRSPCFLIIKNISENEKGEPLFDFHFVSKMETLSSLTLLNEIGIRKLFFTENQDRIMAILEKHEIKPPAEWLKLLEVKPPSSWLEWVGKRFQDVLHSISNAAYEDRMAEIFNALGFEVEQLGYKKEGEYPDGIAYSKDFAIIYDCKNKPNYFLNANDKRAMIKYVNHTKRRIEEQRGIEKAHFAFIAHSFDNIEKFSDIEKETSSKGFSFTSETMLYLLFKKISLGRNFLLADFEDLISNKTLTIKDVDKIYGS